MQIVTCIYCDHNNEIISPISDRINCIDCGELIWVIQLGLPFNYGVCQHPLETSSGYPLRQAVATSNIVHLVCLKCGEICDE